MYKLQRYLFIVLLVFLFSNLLEAQELEARTEIKEELPSSATDINFEKNFDRTKTPNFPKEKIFVIVKRPEKILYGNPCMEEITNGMGFQYLLIPKTSADGYTNENPFWHNLGVHFKLMKKNGIFYKRKLRRAVKFCRQMSGDFVAYNSGNTPE